MNIHFSSRHVRWAGLGLAVLAGLVLAATAFTPASQPTGSISQVEVTNYNLTSGYELVYKTDYEKINWTGNVHAYPVSASGTVNTSADFWSDGANSVINQQSYTSRIIVTMNGSSGVPFEWANLSAAQQTALGTATTGPQILNFVRGDRSNETPNGANFRARAATLGDILHSRPYYLANNGNPVLFVGANDGMLHAIDARTNGGSELWAYVPSMLIPNLKNLTVTPYVHTYFVDGGLNVGNVTINSAARTVLVSELGAGGQGLFALDITNPIPTSENTAAANALWEITNTTINGVASTSYANLGYTYGTPVIAKANTGQSVVVIGNGYNATGASTLYVIDAGSGALIKAITTSGAPNGGLSSPGCYDANGDGTIDYCYAGDIDGKLWKFDLSSASAASWSAKLLYTTSPAQAITMAPSITAHPNGGVMLNFGTGRVFATADSTDVGTYYAYGIWDYPPLPNGTTAPSTLLTQTLQENDYSFGTSPNVTTTRARVVTTSNTPNWAVNLGWQVALPTAGERIVSDTVFTSSGRFYFMSTNPTITNTSPVPNGENWLTELNYLTGGAPSAPFFDMNGDLVVNAADRVSTNGTLNTTSSGIPVSRFIDTGVTSQPILVQLATLNTTLYNQNPDVTIPATSNNTGVAGGHFDVDIYYPSPVGSTTWTYKTAHHVHQYDKIYNVTGVNMLAASDIAFDINNPIPSTTTGFKILLQNQYLNPAVQINVGGQGYTPVKLFQGQAATTSELLNGAWFDTAPIYTRSNISTLVFNMPVTAFQPQDWWTLAGGDSTIYAAGSVRVGLQPTQTNCVNAGSSTATDLYYQAVVPPSPLPTTNGPGTTSTTGVNALRHNGALVIQLTKSNTTSAMIEEQIAGQPEYGWRVKAAYYNAQVLAEWTTFWHYTGNNYCFSTTGWTDNPPLVTPQAVTGQTPAAGSSDPRGGYFGGSGSVVSTVTTVKNNVTTTVTTYSDGTTSSVTTTANSNGTITVTTVAANGSTTTNTYANPSGTVVGGANETRNQVSTGAISWNELLHN
jgi:hypothetical protein